MLALALATMACHVGGHVPFVRPDNVCTPGRYERLSRQQVCTHKERPALSEADRRWILTRYGVPGWSGRDGELDHRVPFFLGGTTDRRNIWPEPERVPNTKDRLEFYIYARVCVRHTMRVRTARLIFLADWVASYRKYFAPERRQAPGRVGA